MPLWLQVAHWAWVWPGPGPWALAHGPSKVSVFLKTISSRLGLRIEISERYYRQATRNVTDVPHLFVFMEQVINPMNQFSMENYSPCYVENI